MPVRPSEAWSAAHKRLVIAAAGALDIRAAIVSAEASEVSAEKTAVMSWAPSPVIVAVAFAALGSFPSRVLARLTDQERLVFNQDSASFRTGGGAIGGSAVDTGVAYNRWLESWPVGGSGGVAPQRRAILFKVFEHRLRNEIPATEATAIVGAMRLAPLWREASARAGRRLYISIEHARRGGCLG